MVTFQLTHLLRGATKQHFLRHAASHFQLTHLLRGATNSGPGGRPDPGFQLTHLLRGATTDNVGLADAVTDFNSRTSCEVRRWLRSWGTGFFRFQLTHLLRGATDAPETAGRQQLISTHAPLARCDIRADMYAPGTKSISTHAPLARCDTILGCRTPFR